MANQSGSFKLKEKEKELLRTKSIEINKILINMGLSPLRDSELLHNVLVEAIQRMTVNSKGQIYIGSPLPKIEKL